MLRHVREAQALPFVKNHAEDAVADGGRSDGGALLARDAGGDEGLDAAVVADDREGAVTRADEVASLIDDLLQHGVERELGGHVQPCAVQRQKLAVLTLQTVMHAVDGPQEDHAEEGERRRHHAVERQPRAEIDLADRGDARRFQYRHERRRRGQDDPPQTALRQIQLRILPCPLCLRGCGDAHAKELGGVHHSLSRMRSNWTFRSSAARTMPKRARGGAMPKSVMRRGMSARTRNRSRESRCAVAVSSSGRAAPAMEISPPRGARYVWLS